MISIDLLKCACIASLLNEGARDQVGPRFNPLLCKAKYLWLDRLCIMQTNKQDKNWQIKHMFELYSHCRQCLVLPGGIQRLVSLDEETWWVHRAWTLQEAMAPRASFVLFAWKWKSGELSNPRDSRVKLRVVVPGRCGLTALIFLVTSCIYGTLNFKGEITYQKRPTVSEG